MNKIFILFFSFLSAVNAKSEQKHSDLDPKSDQIEKTKLQEARDVIKNASQETEKVFLTRQEKDLKGSGDKTKKQKKGLRTLLEKYADTRYIARVVFPQKKLWKKLSTEQKDAYFDLFSNDIVNTYYNMLGTEYQKKIRLDIGKARRIPSKKYNFFRVETTFNSTPPVKLTWMLNSTMKIIDLNVEGASLMRAKKKEYKSLARQCMSSKGKMDFDKFLSKIKELSPLYT